MSRGRDRRGFLRGLIVTVLLLAVMPFAAIRAHAVEVIDIGAPAATIDVTSGFAGLDTDRQSVAIERPDAPPGAKQFMTLESDRALAAYHWMAAGFRNSSSVAETVVIHVPDSGFVGSGLLRPRPPGSEIIKVVTAGAITLQPATSVGGRAYVFTLGPGTSGAIAFQTERPGLQSVELRGEENFSAQKDYFAFFRGALLGISLLLALAMLALYGFRARAVFLAAAGFAFACVAFIALEAGHLGALLGRWPALGVNLAVARAIVEGALAATLLLLLGTQAELRRASRVASNVILLLGGLSFAIPVYGFVEPALAAAVARGLFGATAVAGFLALFLVWRRGEQGAEAPLVTWGAVLLWAFAAMAAALADPRSARLEPLLLAGLCAVLVIMGFTLAHFAFSQGYLSRHFFREAGRRALALAGARAYVWDWQPEDGELFVGEEIEAALGLPPGMMADGGAEGFMELIHPADRSAYLAAVEQAEAQGRGSIEREFRLRHGDGSWRWFLLRGRAMAGHGSRAIRCIGTLTDVTGAKRTEERLLSDAVYDAVTGLPNRALFLDRLARALSHVEPAPGGEIYVALIDIDRFKMMNDALGHEAGDGLLAIIGRRLTASVNPEDTVARLPGDQFAVLFAGNAQRDVVAFTEDLRRTVARPILLDDQELFLTASIGVAHGADTQSTAEQLMKDAAIALYEAKRQGPDSIMVFRSSMRDDRAELVVLESELRRAIERNEIEVHYQPIARLADLNLAGFEALVRWRHPVLGLLSPESFIGLAEQTGMIRDIGRAVINEAARQLGVWQRAFRPAEPVFVAVNVSSAQLIDAALIDEIKQILHREGVHRQSLKIEITESLMMQYPERAAQVLERLREMGVGLACDDFGTGYSSLSTLRKLPFDTLKVDKSFIEPSDNDERAAVILQAILSMAHDLGLNVVAEGIENQEQVDRLGALACDMGQGYFIGPPMTAKQVSEALAGLPYASASGRTAITWLWERAARDPSPSPNAIVMTGAAIAEMKARREAEEEASRPPPPSAPPAPAPVTTPPPAAPPVKEQAKDPPPGNARMAPRFPRPEAEPVPPPPAAAEAAADQTGAGDAAEDSANVSAINRPKPRRRRRKKEDAPQA
jgi:diguanylate cyclase (GGDEF)-like protein